MTKSECRVPLLLWPLWAVWRLVVFILEFTGRLVGAILGFVLIITGLIVSLTIVGLVVGIPLMIFGFLLLLRSIF